MNAPAEVAATPGERLRREREVRGTPLAQVAEALHVDVHLLEAIEQDQFAQFDAPVYAKGYLRKYATYLGVAPEDVIAAYDRLHGAPASPTLIPAASAREVQHDASGLRTAALILLAVIVLGGSWWWWFVRPATPGANRVAGTTAVPEATPTPASSALPAVVAVAESAVPSAAPMVATTMPGASVPVAATPVEIAPAPAAPGAKNGGFSITFRADCWTEVYDGRGTRLYYDLVNRGQTRSFTGRGPWRVFLGNAEAARVTVGGQSVPIPATARRDETARFILAGDGTVR